jgi:hypothetical protein
VHACLPLLLLLALSAVCRATLDSLEVVFLHLTLQKLVNYNMAHKLPVLAE